MDRTLDLDAPAPARATTYAAPDAEQSRRVGVLIAGAVVLLAVTAGTTAYLLDSDGGSRAATSRSVDASVLESEAKRDAAAASRYLTR